MTVPLSLQILQDILQAYSIGSGSADIWPLVEALCPDYKGVTTQQDAVELINDLLAVVQGM